VWNFTSREESLISDLKSIHWLRTRGFVCYDSDASRNENIKMAEPQLLKEIQSTDDSHPETRIIRITPDGPKKIALDDLLIKKNGLETFHRLKDNALVGSIYDIRDQYRERSNGGVVAASHRDRLRYLTDAETWMLFAHGRWSREESRVKYALGEFLKQSMPRYLSQRDAEELESKYDKSYVKAAKKNIDATRGKLSTARFADAVLRLASEQPALAAKLSDFDSNPMLLGIPGGKVVDLTSGKREMPWRRTSSAAAPPSLQPTRTIVPSGKSSFATSPATRRN